MGGTANAFRDYETRGEADAASARGAARTDLIIGALIGIVPWPFPFARVVFRGLAGSDGAGWAIHVPALLLFMVTIAWLCSALSMSIGHRTVGMYFTDLGFAETPRLTAALGAACPWTLAGLAAVVGVRGPAARFARTRLRSTRASG